MPNTQSQPPTIELKRQADLSPGRLWELTIAGLRQRLYRSSITILVVSVSTAFLVQFVLTGLFGLRIEETARNELRELRLASSWAAFISRPFDFDGAVRAVAEPPYPLIRENLKRFSGLEDNEFHSFQETAREAIRLKAFGTGLSVVERRDLDWDDDLRKLPILVQDMPPGNWKARLTPALLRQLPGNWDGLLELRQKWPRFLEQMEHLQQQHASAVEAAANGSNGRDSLQLLAFGPELSGAILRTAGFQIGDDQLASIQGQAGQTMAIAELERRLNRANDRRALAGLLKTTPDQLESAAVWEALVRPEAVMDLNKRLEAINPSTGAYDPEAVSRAAEVVTEINRAEAVLGTVSRAGLGLGQPVRLAIYLGVSLLVCLVGVSNALLMSVSERSREIATMKCIGALDGVILRMVFLEAALIGLVGGILGAISGLLVAIVPGLSRFGSYLAAALAPGLLASVAGLAIFAGLLIAAASALYPAWRASRLAPMEAMRIE